MITLYLAAYQASIHYKRFIITRMSEKTINLTLMRHARSRADDEGVHEGRYDSPLTETGRNQIRRRAEIWLTQDITFDCIVASTLVRAYESAQIIGTALNIPVETDPDWMEFNNGPLAALPFAEAERLYPKPAFRNLYEPFLGSGESEWRFHSRASQAVENVILRGPGSYLIVAHGGILNAALRIIMGIQPPLNGSGFWFIFGDAGYVRLVYKPDQHFWGLLEFVPQI